MNYKAEQRMENILRGIVAFGLFGLGFAAGFAACVFL